MSEEQLKAHEERIREIVDIAVLLAPEPPQDGQKTYTAKQMRVAVHEALLIPNPTPPAVTPNFDIDRVLLMIRALLSSTVEEWEEHNEHVMREALKSLVAPPARVSLLQSYARHASARAVEDERQRLVRLVDEEIKLYSIPLTEEHYKDEALRQDRNTWRSGVVFGLKKVASWLTGDVGEKK